jgi:hypothetical protein
MKKTLATLFLLWSVLFAQAQYLEDIRSIYTYPFDTRNFSIGVDQYGIVRYVTLFGEQILAKEGPVAVAIKDGKAYASTDFECNFDVATIGFTSEVSSICLKLDIDYNGSSITGTVAYADWEKGPDAVLLFPVCLNLTESVGEAIGVAQGRGLAFGIQALNTKINAGFPANCTQQVSELLHYDADPERAAMATPEGTCLQFSAYDRFRPHIRDTYGHEGALAYYLDFPEGSINDASLVLFACRQQDVMGKLAEIEIQEGLVHPTFNDSVWNKLDPMATQSYLCNEYDAKDAAFVSKKCLQAGLDLGRTVQANRIPAVAPLNTDNLLIQGELKLQLPLDATQTEFAVYHSDLFNQHAYLNVLLIDEELVTYRSQEAIGDIHVFYGCTRGAFGTKKVAHKRNAFTFKLWDHPDHTLVPTPKAQDKMVTKEAKKCAKSDAPLLIFNDLKSYAYNGLGDWAITRMLDTMQSYNPDKMLQADQLTHGSWHYLTRVNDNTLWNVTQRSTMAEALAKKQAYYRGNLIPWMIGNFQIHLADKNRKATTMEALEWFLANAAAFDAGFGLDFDANTMRKHGLTDAMLDAINIWESLRLSGAFSEAQKEAFKDPYSNWHIEKGEDSAYLLYPQHISRGYLCNFTDDTWQWNSPYKSRYALRIEVEGKGSISEMEVRTPNGILYLPCNLKGGQCLVYDFDGTAYVADQNYNKLQEVTARGVAYLDEGESEVSFRCEVKSVDKKTPQVTVRFFTRGDAEVIKAQ